MTYMPVTSADSCSGCAVTMYRAARTWINYGPVSVPYTAGYDSDGLPRLQPVLELRRLLELRMRAAQRLFVVLRRLQLVRRACGRLLVMQPRALSAVMLR